MLVKRFEQRVAIKFLVKMETATEAFNLLREAYGENTLSRRARVFECAKGLQKEVKMWKMANDLAIR
jgi:hypothetical protein